MIPLAVISSDKDEEWRAWRGDANYYLDTTKAGMRALLYEVDQCAAPTDDFSLWAGQQMVLQREHDITSLLKDRANLW